MTEKKMIVSNSDNEDLEEVFGIVDGVNGPGAEEIQDFTPIRDELIMLAIFWAETELCVYFSDFLDDHSDIFSAPLGTFASRRINRIGKILGEDEVKRAIDGAHAKFKEERNISDRVWNMFRNATPEQREEIREKIQRETKKQTS